MDLVKIGYTVVADGLAKANKEIDDLLVKAEKLNNVKVKMGGKGGNSSASSSTSKNSATQLDAAEKMIKKQELLNKHLANMDSATAKIATQFSLVSDSVTDLERFLNILGQNKAAMKLQRDAETLRASNIKAVEDQQKANDKYFSKKQQQYQKDIEAAASAEATAAERAEKARQKKLKAEQDYYQKTIEAEKTKEAKALQAQEDARQKRFKAEQIYYQRQMALAETAAHKEALVQQRYNDKIQQTVLTTQYRQQGLSATNSSKLAAMQISGADAATVDRYKQALLDAQAAMQGLGTAAVDAEKKVGFFHTQIGGIVKYALLSAAIYGTISAVVGLGKAFVSAADEYTSTQNRLKLYIKDAETLANVNNFLAKSAIDNNIGLRENAALYAKLAPSMQRIGANTAATQQVVDAFGKSLRVGGATATEAAAATIQFAQAMASGKLAGDEFRSISEASPRFLQAIADGSGHAAEKLKAMSSEGKLTTEVISRALVKEYANLSKESKSLGITLEQGSNAIKTGFEAVVGSFNEGAGITKFLGEALAGLGVKMVDGSLDAKALGESFREWATGVAPVVIASFEALRAAATIYAGVLAGRLVTSLALAARTAAVTAAQNIALNATILASNVAATRAATGIGILRVGLGGLATAATAVKTALGGWVGVVTTIASVLLSYSMFKDSANDSAKALEQQSEYINKTTEELKALNAEQRNKAKFEVEVDLEKANKDIKQAKAEYLDLLETFSFNLGNRGKIFDKDFTTELEAIKVGLSEGSVTFDEATKRLYALGAISKEDVVTFNKQAKAFDDTVNVGAKLANVAKTLGSNMSLVEEATANGTSAQNAMSKALKDVSEQARIAGSSIDSLVDGYKKSAKETRVSLALSKQYALDKKHADDLTGDASKQFDAAKAVRRPSATVADFVSKDRVAAALDDQAAQKERADYDASLKPKKKSEINNFPEQLAAAKQYVQLIGQGYSIEVARTATQKDYIKWYGQSLDMAKQMADVEDARTRANAQYSLKQQMLDMKEITAFQAAGVDYETAKLAVQNKYLANDAGIQYADNLHKQAVNDLLLSLEGQVDEQKGINTYLKQGLTLDEARAAVVLERVGVATKESAGIAQNVLNNAKLLVIEKAREAFQTSFNDAAREEASIRASLENGLDNQTLRLAEIRNQYRGIGVDQAAQLAATQDSSAMLKEQVNYANEWSAAFSTATQNAKDVNATYAFASAARKEAIVHDRELLKLAQDYAARKEEAKKTPLGDFSAINFDAFGDIGNPFQSALEGANALAVSLREVSEGMATVAKERTRINVLMEQAKGNDDLEGQAALATKLSELNALEEEFQKTKQKGNEIAFGKGLTLAKSFFKEGSKGYQLLSGFEKAYQASKIAFSLWEKKDQVAKVAASLAGYVKEGLAFASAAAAKIAAQVGINSAKATEVILTQGTGDPYTAPARMSAMIAVIASLGIAIAGIGSIGGSGSYDSYDNTGTGTVFGDANGTSKSIKNAMEILADNSDLNLPISSAILRSVENIESSIGGVANLLIRGDVGSSTAIGGNVDAKLTGVIGTLSNFQSKIFNFISGDWLTGFGIGDMLSGVFNTVLGGLFGKTSSSVTAQGLAGGKQSLGDIVNNGMNLSEYADVKTTKKSWFSSSTSYSTQYADASQEMKDQFTLIFSNLYDSMLSASSILGKETGIVADKVSNFIIDIGKINVKDLSGTEIQEKLEAVIGAEADKVAKAALSGLEAFQKVGEGYYETVVRVVAGIEEAQYYADRLGVTAVKYTDIIAKQGDVAAELLRQSILAQSGISTVKGGFADLVSAFSGSAEEIANFVVTLKELQDAIYATGHSGDYLTSSMILGAGGADNLKSGLDSYFDMLSSSEQATELTRRLTREFDALGLSLPSNNEGFKQLVKGLDITTESGQKLYGQVLALAPEFTDLQDVLDESRSAIDSLVSSLRDLAEQASSAIASTDQTSNLDYLRYQFNADSILAMQGDQDAATRLLDLGKDLLSVSKQYAVDGSAYAQDLALVQRAATVSADAQEAGLGYSNPSLTTVSSTGTDTVLSTDTSSTDAKLEALRADMLTAITAVAKYTQDTADRLARWDDGYRLNVRVDQENGDSPIKVQSV